MTAIHNMPKKAWQLPTKERWRAVEPYRGFKVRVTYRNGSYSKFTQTAEGTCMGASAHLTNGNSTGDLILYRSQHMKYGCVSIALAHVADIEVLGRGEIDL